MFSWSSNRAVITSNHARLTIKPNCRCLRGPPLVWFSYPPSHLSSAHFLVTNMTHSFRLMITLWRPFSEFQKEEETGQPPPYPEAVLVMDVVGLNSLLILISSLSPFFAIKALVSLQNKAVTFQKTEPSCSFWWNTASGSYHPNRPSSQPHPHFTYAPPSLWVQHQGFAHISSQLLKLFSTSTSTWNLSGPFFNSPKLDQSFDQIIISDVYIDKHTNIEVKLPGSSALRGSFGFSSSRWTWSTSAQ